MTKHFRSYINIIIRNIRPLPTVNQHEAPIIIVIHITYIFGIIIFYEIIRYRLLWKKFLLATLVKVDFDVKILFFYSSQNIAFSVLAIIHQTSESTRKLNIFDEMFFEKLLRDKSFSFYSRPPRGGCRAKTVKAFKKKRKIRLCIYFTPTA